MLGQGTPGEGGVPGSCTAALRTRDSQGPTVTLWPRADVLSSPGPHCQELISGCSALQGGKKKKKKQTQQKKGFGLLSLGEMSRMI